jgi:hypothetical protein
MLVALSIKLMATAGGASTPVSTGDQIRQSIAARTQPLLWPTYSISRKLREANFAQPVYQLPVERAGIRFPRSISVGNICRPCSAKHRHHIAFESCS